jgi:hypothetical protein
MVLAHLPVNGMLDLHPSQLTVPFTLHSSSFWYLKPLTKTKSCLLSLTQNAEFFFHDLSALLKLQPNDYVFSQTVSRNKKAE